MKFLSVCSGIEAASVAWHDLGFECVGVSEIDKFPSEVLKYHYPSVPNLGDMTQYKEWNDDLAPDLLVGGTPCQSFSVAGLRKGMDDPRGNLALTYVGIAAKYKPQWFIWENVPGVLSSNGGKDFSSFLSAMADIGYGIAYRVLDAQFFGVPQRRRRVFVVGYLGDYRPAVSVLFEPTSVFGHTPKGRKARKGTTASAETSLRDDDKLAFRKSRRAQTNTDNETWVDDGLSNTLNNFDLGDIRTTHAVVTKESSVYENHPQDSRVKEMGNISHTVAANWGMGGGNVPFVRESIDNSSFYLYERLYGGRTKENPITSPTIEAKSGTGGNNVPIISGCNTMRVRRLTPIECERLQGFPDGWTQIPYGKKSKEQCPDGHRYKALGNSMAVPVMKWIGRRIKLFNEVSHAIQSATLGKTSD
jgi:DNA (cytosine-5)-methyltransferase 1